MIINKAYLADMNFYIIMAQIEKSVLNLMLDKNKSIRENAISLRIPRGKLTALVKKHNIKLKPFNKKEEPLCI